MLQCFFRMVIRFPHIFVGLRGSVNSTLFDQLSFLQRTVWRPFSFKIEILHRTDVYFDLEIESNRESLAQFFINLGMQYSDADFEFKFSKTELNVTYFIYFSTSSAGWFARVQTMSVAPNLLRSPMVERTWCLKKESMNSCPLRNSRLREGFGVLIDSHLSHQKAAGI